MIPFRDDNPRTSFPLITILIIAANAVVWLYEFLLMSSSEQAFNEFLYTWALIPRQLFANPIASAPTLISSMFMHGSWEHIIGNMVFLWVFGDNIEDKLGKFLYPIFYLACGFAASAAQILIDPNSNIPNLGASGAIAGVLGGYLVLFPRSRVQALALFGGFGRIIFVPALYMLGFWFVMQLLPGFLSIGSQEGGVAYFAHIGGFLAGGVAMLVYGPIRAWPTVLTGANQPPRDQFTPSDDYRNYR